MATATDSFEKLRQAGCVCVDKADMSWRFVAGTEGGQFFIACPRPESAPYRGRPGAAPRQGGHSGSAADKGKGNTPRDL